MPPFPHSLSCTFRSMLVALLAVGLACSSQAATPKNSATPIFYVPLNRSELVTAPVDLNEVIIADPEVADVYVHGKRRVSVIGKNIGQTTLRLFDNDHKLVRSMDVFVTYDLPALRRALKEYLPGERIGVSMINTRIALTGDISSAAAATTAMEIAQEFTHAKLKDTQADSRRLLDEATENSPVINLMKISSGQQVMLRIRIGEIQRSVVKNLGVNLTALANGESGFLIGTGTGQFGNHDSTANRFGFNRFFGVTGGDSFGIGNAKAKIGGTNLSALVDALERDGLIKILAEPNLTALSGEEAQFLAGGEFPIPVPQQLGTTTVEYKPFGVALKFTPFVLSQNRLRIQVQPEVSEISNEQLVQTSDGFSAPSIITRRASTTVELAPGESFMIAGLIRDDLNTRIDQIPGASNIPVLGALFRSTAFQRNETELVITVTPYLVDPVKDADIKMPTDDFRPASFMESIFFGTAASNTGSKNPSLEGPTGFMTD